MYYNKKEEESPVGGHKIKRLYWRRVLSFNNIGFHK
jgi:hypothetical protein